MSSFILLSALFISSLGGKLFLKLCSDSVVGNSKDRYAVFMTVNGLIACAFFFVSGGFNISLNPATVIYSIIYTVIVILSLVFNMASLKYINISAMTVILSALGLITTSALGALLFGESLDLLKLIRIAIMLAAVLLSFADGRAAGSKKNCRPFSLKALIIIAVLLIVGCANTIITKYFAIDTRVTDENSFFFFTNVILVAASVLLLIFDLIRKPHEIKKALPLFRPLNFLSLAGNTVCSNVGSLLGLILIAEMDVSVYSPVSSALGILAGFIASLIFRQKMGVFSYLSVICAIIAVVI